MYFHLLFLFSQLFFDSSNTCEKYRAFYQAEDMYGSGQVDSAIVIYRSVFKDGSFGNVSHTLNTASKILKVKDVEFSKHLLKLTVSKGLIDSTFYSGFLKRFDIPEIQYINDFISKEEYKFICDQLKVNNDMFMINKIDSLLEIDQKLRADGNVDSRDSKSASLQAFDNILILIKYNNNKYPTYDQLGAEASSNLMTLLLHMEFEQLSYLFPYVKEAIENGDFWDNESFLYQLERSTFSDNKLFKYKKELNTIEIYSENKKINGLENAFYANYGTLDYFINKEVGIIWWPFNPDLNKEVVDEMRKSLCLPSLDQLLKLNSHIKLITDKEFVELHLKYFGK